MALLKRSLVLAALAAAAVVAEPQVPGQNQYLPPAPSSPGYNYPKPTVPFPSPPSRPGTPPPRPPPPPPSIRPPPGPRPLPPTGPTGPTGPAPYPPPIDNGILLPEYRPPPSGGGGGDHHHDHSHHEPGMPFDFAYAVKDDQYGTDYSHNAVSDGDVVRGEYRVQLPDGRLQIVRYTADWATGFHADVQYEGTPRYPDGPSAGAFSGPSSYGPPAPQGGRRPGGGY